MKEIKSPPKNSTDSQPMVIHDTPLDRIRGFVGRFRIRTVLTVSLVIVLIIAMGITGYLAFLNSQYAVNEMAGQLQNEVTVRIEQHLDMYLGIPHLINQLCINSIRSGELNVHDNEGLKRHFQELSYQFGSVSAICYGNEPDGNYTIISVVGKPGLTNGTDRFWAISPVLSLNSSYEEYRIDRAGRIVENTLSYPHYDPRTRPWYQAAVQAGVPAWTPIFMWLEVGAVSMDAVVPVYSDQNTLLGVMDTSLTLMGIGDFLQNLQISRHGQAFIIERSGLLVASSSVKEPYTRVNGELVRLNALDSNDSVVHEATQNIENQFGNLTTIETSRQFYSHIGGERQFVQITPYHDNHGLDWLIVVVIPESDFMEKINANTHTTILLILSAVIGTIIICIFLARWITRPILSMNQSAKALAQGDWTSWTELDRHDELGELSHSFKQMANQLRTTFFSLKCSEERYVNLFQSSADAILLFDGFSLIHINHAGEEMFRINGAESTGKDVRELFGRVGYSMSEMIESSLKVQNTSYLDQTVSRIIDGEEQFINIRLTHFLGEETEYCLIHIRDITDQRRAIISFAEQEALQESYSHIRMILQLLPDPTFVVDIDGKVLFWNQAIEKMTGVKADDIIGKGDYAYAEAMYGSKRLVLIDFALHPETADESQYEHIERSGDVFTGSLWVKSSGKMKYFSAIAARIYHHNGQITGAIESIRDITLHKVAEESLLIANKKLNLLNSITRHDILNKIAISRGHVFLLEGSELDTIQKHSIEALKRSIADIERFISFTGIYHELGLKNPTWQDVRETFCRAVAGVDTGAVVINIEIQGITILADSLFEKICYNLIDNAIRHGVHLTKIDITADETPEGLRISVEDDGGGVPDDMKEMIFERGYGKNTGYGLFLAREILSLSKSTITERGVYGISCRFDIDIPKGKYYRILTEVGVKAHGDKPV